MRRRTVKSIAALEETLDYGFSNPELLQRALTHSSARARGRNSHDYERLEILGDRVLGLVIAELLAECFPEAREGDLARQFNKLVRRETCAEVAAGMNLGDFVIMSAGEAESGGRGKQTILGDACEAVLGAIFLDGGYEAARVITRRLWSERIGDETIPLRDAKSALQEWAQGRGLELPNYVELVREGPDHAPRFTTRVEVQGLEPSKGQGTNKRAAEQSAATAMLKREGVWKNDDDD